MLFAASALVGDRISQVSVKFLDTRLLDKGKGSRIHRPHVYHEHDHLPRFPIAVFHSPSRTSGTLTIRPKSLAPGGVSPLHAQKPPTSRPHSSATVTPNLWSSPSQIPRSCIYRASLVIRRSPRHPVRHLAAASLLPVFPTNVWIGCLNYIFQALSRRRDHSGSEGSRQATTFMSSSKMAMKRPLPGPRTLQQLGLTS